MSHAAAASAGTATGDAGAPRNNVVVMSSGIPSFDARDAKDVDFTLEKMTAEEYAVHKAGVDKRKAEFFADVAERQAALKASGCDRQATPAHYPHPGDAEIATSLQSVTAGWQDIAAKDLCMYTLSGQPPLDLPADKLAEYTAQARKVTAQHLLDRTLQDMIAQLPPERLAQFKKAYGCPAEKWPSVVPCYWLMEKMQLLCVRHELKHKTSFLLERHAVQSSPEAQWIRAVKLHNGFCKTIIELQAHAGVSIVA